MLTMSVNMVTLLGHQSGAKLTTPKNSAKVKGKVKAKVILRYLCGSEMVLLGVVIGKCEMSSTRISQENEHAILVVKWQFM